MPNNKKNRRANNKKNKGGRKPKKKNSSSSVLAVSSPPEAVAAPSETTSNRPDSVLTSVVPDVLALNPSNNPGAAAAGSPCPCCTGGTLAVCGTITDENNAARSTTVEAAVATPEEEEELSYDASCHLEGIKALVKAGGKINYRKLVKFLPGVVADFKTGKYDPLKVAAGVFWIYLDQVSTETTLLQLRQEYCRHIIDLALPGSIDIQGTNYMQLKGDLWTYFANRFTSGTSTEALNRTLLKDGFEAACRKFVQVLDNISGGEGYFHALCPLLGLSDEEWMSTTQAIHDQIHPRLTAAFAFESKLHSELVDAAHIITRGLDVTMDKCWECNGSLGSFVMDCGGCGTAHYCGPQCQTVAWHGGHKESCKRLARHYKRLIKSLDYLEYVHKQRRGEIHGIFPNTAFDYPLLEAIVRPFYFDSELKESGMDGPKVKHFFRNIAAIQQGKWWLCSETSSESDYLKALADAQPDRAPKDTMRIASVVLCYDLEGAAKEKILRDRKSKHVTAHQKDWGNTDVQVDSAAIQAILPPDCKFLRSCHFFLHNYGVKMPSTLFLKQCLFDESHKEPHHPKSISRWRKISEMNFLKVLQEEIDTCHRTELLGATDDQKLCIQKAIGQA